MANSIGHNSARHDPVTEANGTLGEYRYFVGGEPTPWNFEKL